jgi:hypothetical protein
VPAVFLVQLPIGQLLLPGLPTLLSLLTPMSLFLQLQIYETVGYLIQTSVMLITLLLPLERSEHFFPHLERWPFLYSWKVLVVLGILAFLQT